MAYDIEAGTVIAGTLRSEDLLEAFSSELERLVQVKQKYLRLKTPLGIAYGDWTRIHAHKKLVRQARKVRKVQSEIIPITSDGMYFASEVVNELQDALNEYATDGMYFGTLEGDGADFGWWNEE